jgi:hypothetical protein
MRAIVPLALAVTASGCGTSSDSGSSARFAAIAEAPSTRASCAATVLKTLRHVAMYIYHQGLSGERPRLAVRRIAASSSLRQAVEAGNAVAASDAATVLLDYGPMTNLRVMRGNQVLADVGGPAVTPLRGTLMGAGGQPIGSYVTSVWADEGLIAETNGVTGGRIALRVKGHSVGGSLALPPRPLRAQGTLVHDHIRYQYASFAGERYPSGALRVYLLKSFDATGAACGRTDGDTVVNTLSHIAKIIYAGEVGPRRTVPQIRRAQSSQPLLRAVAAHDPLATKAAITALLTEHVVRMRVSVGGKVLADVGGPYVLAPVTAPLRLAGRTIGSIVLSIQDDEGYLRLTRRLVGLRVLMYMNPAHPQLVKNSLGPEPGTVPSSGPYEYRGHRFRVFTVNATAFPSGPLTIRVLVPMPYA